MNFFEYNGIRSSGAIDFSGGTINMTAADNALDAMEINKSDACTVTINGTPYVG